MTNTNHNFWLGLNKKNDTDSPESLYLFYKTGSKKTLKRLPIKIKPSIWDSSKRFIRASKELEYSSEVD